IIDARGQNPNVALSSMGWFLVEQPVTPRRLTRPRIKWKKTNTPHPSPGNKDPFNVGSNEGSTTWGFRLVAFEQSQNSVTESIHWWDLAKIRTDLKAIAARGRCQEFLTKLLQKAGATGGDPAVHTNIVDLFDAVLLQQGFVTQKDVKGRGFSSIHGAVGAPGGAQVRLSNGSNDFKGKLRIQYFAFDALAELTHVAGSKPSYYAEGAFSDYHLGRTAYDIANEMGAGIKSLPTVDPKNDEFGRWSDFYHDIVKRFCPRQERF
ncbi:MAG TPA: hypothetical protein VJM50_16235, partial [Pyrinomonadaceae bacterium]|nr:hypothetical protein [Pyrinomonadaceae bacterium]